MRKKVYKDNFVYVETRKNSESRMSFYFKI